MALDVLDIRWRKKFYLLTSATEEIVRLKPLVSALLLGSFALPMIGCDYDARYHDRDDWRYEHAGYHERPYYHRDFDHDRHDREREWHEGHYHD